MRSASGHKPRAGKPALQARSADTLERILSAAEALLVDREFDQLSVADIASKAGCAVGTVYGRVADKEHLLFCLHDRYMACATKQAGDLFSTLDDAGLVERVEALCELMVSLFHKHRGVVRAVTNHLYTSPSEAANENMSGFRKNATSMFRSAAAFLAERMPNRTDAQTRTACEFALLAAQDVAQGRIVFGTRSGLALKYSHKELKARTADLILRYLNAHSQTNHPE